MAEVSLKIAGITVRKGCLLFGVCISGFRLPRMSPQKCQAGKSNHVRVVGSHIASLFRNISLPSHRCLLLCYQFPVCASVLFTCAAVSIPIPLQFSPCSCFVGERDFLFAAAGVCLFGEGIAIAVPIDCDRLLRGRKDWRRTADFHAVENYEVFDFWRKVPHRELT